MNLKDSKGSAVPDCDDIELGGNELSRVLRAAAVLVVDDDPDMCNYLKSALDGHFALLEIAGSAEEAEALRLRYHFDVLIVDVRLPGLSGLEWLSGLRERGVRTRVIFMTAHADLDSAVGALRNGADDFIVKPFRMRQLIESIRRILIRGDVHRENALLRFQLEQLEVDNDFIAESEPMRQLLLHAGQIAPSDSCVLIEGETGTGKRLLANTLHKLSRRKGACIAAVCAALQPDKEEDELFGSKGLFVHANKGTLVLVDVETLSPAMQARLVNVLEHGKLGRPALSDETPLDVRVVVTTSTDLSMAVGTGQFRNDLHYKLNALQLSIPALRGRDADIQLLADVFMHRLANRLALKPVELLHEDRKQLSAFAWPGNVLQLHNVIERVLLAGRLNADCFDEKSVPDDQLSEGPGFPLDFNLERVERLHIEAVLESVNKNKSAASRILGVSRKTLERKQALWYGKPVQ